MRRPAVTVKLETGYSYFSSSKCSSHTIAYGKAATKGKTRVTRNDKWNEDFEFRVEKANEI